MGGLQALIYGRQASAFRGGQRRAADDAWSRLDRAVCGLALRRPEYSARTVATRAQLWSLLAVAAVFLLALLQWPRQTCDIAVGFMAAGFLLGIALRCGLVLLRRGKVTGTCVANDLEWPVYSILVPLYHEAGILPQLDEALCALDYPADKLDIHLVLEEDDYETRAAAEDYSYAQVVVPAATPRTKPKACSYAAPSCLGEFVVVFDAEDRPEADQLKKAVEAFRAHPEKSCLQARLVTDRTRSWLQHMFALDYGIWFSALLPGLEQMKAPIPLGGTSNHFRVGALLDAGLWDPFNVTEDADLGVRLARLGMEVGVLDSITFEEAPAIFSVWLRQRTRWLKGYMQTLLVHSRNPVALHRELGTRGLVAIQFFLGGAVWSALVNPWLWLFFIISALSQPINSGTLSALAQICGASLLLVNAILAALGALAVRDGKRPSLLVIASYPIYWLLMSIAAYRALWQLCFAPFHWEKTPHGTGASS